MDKYAYELDPKFRPLSPWAYFGYGILFAIPVVGFVLLIVFSFSDGNINRKNFARSYFCALLILVILFIISIAILVFTGGLDAFVKELNDLWYRLPV